MRLLVTGSAGLIGSEAVGYFSRRRDSVVGIDNNQRLQFFGPDGDTSANLHRLKAENPTYQHFDLDITDRQAIADLFLMLPFDAVIHCASQPSHDLAAKMPLMDFDINAVGTLNLLEATRFHSPKASFIFMSTNKVYGDAPNEIPMKEKSTRWDYDVAGYRHGINETMRIDASLHSLFGVSKAAADLLVQEYGRYFGMNTVCFRGGCLTGPDHAGAELHGFLSYLAKCVVEGRPFHVYGYKGKQVRDQIHAADVVTAFDAYLQNPRPAAVYNLGGGRDNSISVLEAIDALERLTGNDLEWDYIDQPRAGDHICYITDMRKFRKDYPDWNKTRPLQLILEDLVGKSTKVAAGYRPSKNAESCDTCHSFQAPESCSEVYGPIRRHDVCDLFQLRARKRLVV